MYDVRVRLRACLIPTTRFRKCRVSGLILARASESDDSAALTGIAGTAVAK